MFSAVLVYFTGLVFWIYSSSCCRVPKTEPSGFAELAVFTPDAIPVSDKSIQTQAYEHIITQNIIKLTTYQKPHIRARAHATKL